MPEISTEIHGTSRIVIHEGKLKGFKRLSVQWIELVRIMATGTLEYEYFLNMLRPRALPRLCRRVPRRHQAKRMKPI